MASSDYAVLTGAVQKFPDKPLIVERDVNGSIVREFSVKSAVRASDGTQKIIKVQLWPEYAHVTITAGDGVTVEGKLNVSQGQTQTFYSISAKTIAVTRAETPERTEPANADASAAAEDAPF